VRHCRESCSILPYLPFTNESVKVDREPCPILDFKKTRKASEWHFVKDGEKLVPLCEENSSRTSAKKGLLVL
jgi:hypothetical protein